MDNLGGSASRMKAIEELLRGRNRAKELRSVIDGSGENGSSATPLFAKKLVKEVLMSFTNSLLLLQNNPSSDDVSSVQVWDSPKHEDSQESNCKNSTVKARRGCYKRRRTEQTREEESEAPIDDGHQWRKYGQKEILNAKFPRNYYRCTHRDQGCTATKQVQRVQEDPILYKTIYYGDHTCKSLENPQIILDPVLSPSSSSKFLSFDNSFPTPSKQECPFLSSSFTSSVKRECKEEVPPSTSSNDYLISSDLTFDGSPRHVTLSSSTLDSEYNAVDISDVFCDSAQLDEVFEPFLEFR